MPENVAWQAAQYADQHIALWFHGQDDWPAARELFASTIMPLLDAPAGGETLAVLGSWSPDAVESARAAREQMRDHLMPMP